ncbi:MAG: hypothetical protein ACQET6_12430 [Bacillota bacterium]|uniref:hypothetical protein n=1 Tax=Rossellomorea sp. FM04394 TaxID=3243076 RepID=UPI0035A5B5CD
MDQTSTDKPPCHVLKLKNEIVKLNQRVIQLEKEVKSIQENCRHVFYETDVTRSCIKCHYVESTYY